MTDKKSASVDLLRSLLAVLVDEWGYEVVRMRLDESRSGGPAQPEGSSQDESKVTKGGAGERRLEKVTASSLASKVSLPSHHKRLIELLAEQYDRKQFLPTASDIRYFFEVHGEMPPMVKQRIEAFRKVLRLLSTLPESALQRIIEDDAHRGPSRLAPLSEAMRGVGEQRSMERGPGLGSSKEASQSPPSSDGPPNDDSSQNSDA
jgi:hypothetical protein